MIPASLDLVPGWVSYLLIEKNRTGVAGRGDDELSSESAPVR